MRFVLPLLILAALLAYIGRHVWILLPFGAAWKAVTVGVMLLLFLLLPLFMMLSGRLPMSIEGFIYKVSTAWFFIVLYLLMLFIVIDVVRLVVPSVRPLFVHNGVTTAVIALVVAVIFILGNIIYHHKKRIAMTVKVEKPLKRHYRIVTVSDLHLGYTIGERELEGWIKMINKEKPDLVLVGGDLVDYTLRPLEAGRFAEILRRIDAPLGVYACLGNHDYIAGADKSLNFMKTAGIRPLCDAAALVDSAFYIIGRDDRTNGRRKPLGELLKGLDKQKPLILLDHQPYHLEEGRHGSIDFQFSGHTHRGQVFPINLITDKIYECSHGILKRDGTFLFVSSGIGIWGGKFRIGSRSDYGVVTLTGR